MPRAARAWATVNPSGWSRSRPATTSPACSTAAAEKLERPAESDIILQFGLQGFDPDCADWKTLAAGLIVHGYSVLMAWPVTGSIRAMAARANSGAGVRGIERLPEVLQLPEEQAHDLVMDLLEFAVDRFRSLSLAQHRWSPTGGASLRT